MLKYSINGKIWYNLGNVCTYTFFKEFSQDIQQRVSLYSLLLQCPENDFLCTAPMLAATEFPKIAKPQLLSYTIVFVYKSRIVLV